MMLRTFLLAQLLILVSCVHLSDVPALPQDFSDRFQAGEEWLSITSIDSTHPYDPLPEILVTKRWSVGVMPSGRKYLDLIATTAPDGLAETLATSPARVYLDDDMTAEFFMPSSYTRTEAARPIRADVYDYYDIDKERFGFAINQGRGQVVFMPAPKDNPKIAVAPAGRRFGIWSTPFGSANETLSALESRLTDDGFLEQLDQIRQATGETRFLHHDVTVKKPIPVYIDDTFPKSYLPPLKEAVALWNKAFQLPLFSLQTKPQKLDPARCYAERMLCVTWLGPSRFNYIGLSAFTVITHDPVSGLILGGYITVVNEKSRQPLRPAPESLKKDAENKKLDLDEVAAAMTNSSAYATYLHPAPNALIQRLFVHEIGHFNGLGHNFAPATDESGQTLRTAMAYLPFPMAFKRNELGSDDRALLDIIYKGILPKNEIPFCSTLDGIYPYGKRGTFYKLYPCDVNTLGNKADWYIRLAKTGQQGVFTRYPDLRDLPADTRHRFQMMEEAGFPPGNILTHLGYALAQGSGIPPEDEEKIVNFLCDQKDSLAQIKDQLLLHHQFVLVCKKW